jgi:hypothetical protein
VYIAIHGDVPATYAQAMATDDAAKWTATLQGELLPLHDKGRQASSWRTGREPRRADRPIRRQPDGEAHGGRSGHEAFEAYRHLLPLRAGAGGRRRTGQKQIRSRWVLSNKVSADGATRHKARLVACGYAQIEGIDSTNTYQIRITHTIVFNIDLGQRHMDMHYGRAAGYIILCHVALCSYRDTAHYRVAYRRHNKDKSVMVELAGKRLYYVII